MTNSFLCDRIIDCGAGEAHASLPAPWEVPVPRSSASKPPRPVKSAVKNGGARPIKTSAPKPSDGKKRRGRPPRASTDAAQAAFPGERLIHRYGNRRFYDLRQSRAITLEEIAEFISGGETVRVIDVEADNVDITRRVLTQIILEGQNQHRLELLPVDLLTKVITMQDAALGSWLQQYLSAGAHFLERSTKAAVPAAMTLQETVSHMMGQFMPGAVPEPATATAGARPPVDVQDELRELRRRLDEMTREKTRRG
jgi:polyhydroxyalkanoate synthesis repressor PhaR